MARGVAMAASARLSTRTLSHRVAGTGARKKRLGLCARAQLASLARTARPIRGAGDEACGMPLLVQCMQTCSYDAHACDVPRRLFGNKVCARHRGGPTPQTPPPRGPPQAGLWPLVLSPAEPGTRVRGVRKALRSHLPAASAGRQVRSGAKSDDRRADACISRRLSAY
jgi:hypothetical protein